MLDAESYLGEYLQKKKKNQKEKDLNPKQEI